MAKDSLSALLDGECSPGEIDQILDGMARSPDLGLAWSRLCLARDASEGVRVRKDQPCICSGVMAQIQVQAQMPSAPVTRAVHANTAAAPRMRRRWPGYWKPLAGLAAAASVAAVAFTLGLSGRGVGTAGAPGLVAPQVSTPVSLPAMPKRPRYLQAVSATSAGSQPAVQDDELRNYLIEHSNTLADRGMGATLSYARFAAHSIGEPLAQPAAGAPSGGEQP